MASELFRITLRYEGLDADEHSIDLNQLGQSIQGAAKLLGSAGHIALTGQYAKQQQALSVRVLAGPAEANCYEFVAVLATISPALTPTLPVIKEAAASAVKKAVTGIVNYALAKIGGRRNEADAASEVAKKSLEEMGHTSRVAVEAIARVALGLRPAARAFVVPVGESCALAQIGAVSDGAFPIDKPTRDAIEAPEPMEIGPTSTYDIFLSELDLKKRTCKFELRDQDDSDLRFNGEITDPLIEAPNNPYSSAFNNRRWLMVLAKSRLKDGELERLYISDIAPSRLLVSPT
jgi:hypothetical protein